MKYEATEQQCSALTGYPLKGPVKRHEMCRSSFTRGYTEVVNPAVLFSSKTWRKSSVVRIYLSPHH